MAALSILEEIGRRPLVMGILNATPDSFSDGGLHEKLEAAVARGKRMADEGADIIDIGGESTRPGHQPLAAEEEQARVLPVLSVLTGRIELPISIDTYRASTAQLALLAGARIVNDVWGFQREPDIAGVVADHDAFAVLMHNRDAVDPELDIVEDMLVFFERSLAIARRARVPDTRIVLDPGVGFGKTRSQSLDAIRGIPRLKALGFPVLAGLSRKSFLAPAYPDGVPPAGRLSGTLAAHVYALTLGADIIRVHDVAEHRPAVRITRELMQGERWEGTA